MDLPYALFLVSKCQLKWALRGPCIVLSGWGPPSDKPTKKRHKLGRGGFCNARSNSSDDQKNIPSVGGGGAKKYIFEWGRSPF